MESMATTRGSMRKEKGGVKSIKITKIVECSEWHSLILKIYPEQDLLLFLIEKELYETKMKSELDRIGFINESLFIHDLGDLILSLVGVKDRGDDVGYYGRTMPPKTA